MSLPVPMQLMCHADIQITFFCDRSPEAWPTGTRFKFCIGAEERVTTADAAIETVVMEVEVFAGKYFSVPSLRVTSNCSGVNCCFHSASVLCTFFT